MDATKYAPLCSDFAPPTWSGHWRDWHRGHGCSEDPDVGACRRCSGIDGHDRGCAAGMRAEIDRLRDELDRLKVSHEERRSRVSLAVSTLRETFRLRPGCNNIGDAVEDACAQYRTLVDRIEAVARKCDEIPQWRGTVPQADRFRELLNDERGEG